ncbi:MAG: hypothetical protein QOF85_2356 [Solirubrobacterales bacterium]|nr:hypothetical protein [Solirubrobacterales bacterium]
MTPGADRRHSSLAQHQRHRKTLTPPLMQLPNVQSYPDWRKRRVPDMLWLSAMVDVHAGDWQAAHRALDALDAFIPRGESLWMDGRLSTFGLVPEAAHPSARRALREAASETLVPQLGQALSFFEDCPGAWLFEDWAFETEFDPSAGLAYLRSRMAALEYSRSKHASLVRMIALGRAMYRGKLALPSNLDVIPLMGRYPNLDSDEAQRVEQFSRMTYDMQAMNLDEERFAPVRDRWCKSFWTGCAQLARSSNTAAKGFA